MGANISGQLGNTTGRSVIKKDFIQKASGDCIPDSTMSEIVRRILLLAAPELTSDVVRSEDPPRDHSKFWFKPSTNEIFTWSETDTVWMRTEYGNIIPVLVERQVLTITSDASGNASITINLTKFTDGGAGVYFVWVTDVGTSFRWWVTSQTDATINVTFAGFAASSTYSCVAVIHRTSSS